MARIFEITSSNETIVLDRDGKGVVTFTVTNTTIRPLRSQLKIKPHDDAIGEWFTLQGDTERDLTRDGTTQATIQVAVPSGTPAGKYRFTIHAISASNPEEDFTEGQVVTFEVKPPPPPQPFPWWIPAVVVVVLIVGGVVTWLFLKPVTVPSVAGKTFAEAVKILVDADLVYENTNGGDASKSVLSTAPAEGEKVPKGTGITLHFPPPPSPPGGGPIICKWCGKLHLEDLKVRRDLQDLKVDPKVIERMGSIRKDP